MGSNTETCKKKIVAVFSQFIKHNNKYRRVSSTRKRKYWVKTLLEGFFYFNFIFLSVVVLSSLLNRFEFLFLCMKFLKRGTQFDKERFTFLFAEPTTIVFLFFVNFQRFICSFFGKLFSEKNRLIMTFCIDFDLYESRLDLTWFFFSSACLFNTSKNF